MWGEASDACRSARKGRERSRIKSIGPSIVPDLGEAAQVGDRRRCPATWEPSETCLTGAAACREPCAPPSEPSGTAKGRLKASLPCQEPAWHNFLPASSLSPAALPEPRGKAPDDLVSVWKPIGRSQLAARNSLQMGGCPIPAKEELPHSGYFT